MFWNHFYPRPPRGGRPAQNLARHTAKHISIHALREEGDASGRTVDQSERISIHALREEGDRCCPAWPWRNKNFYPRPPRGGRPTLTRTTPPLSRNFYPRPPRGGRLPILGYPAYFPLFLSTPSARRATVACAVAFRQVRISIHALREEGDLTEVIEIIPITNFYPRPPRGGRRRHRRRQLKNTYISIHALREEGDNPLTERT